MPCLPLVSKWTDPQLLGVFHVDEIRLKYHHLEDCFSKYISPECILNANCQCTLPKFSNICFCCGDDFIMVSMPYLRILS